jgi:hypothetical protein
MIVTIGTNCGTGENSGRSSIIGESKFVYSASPKNPIPYPSKLSILLEMDQYDIGELCL